MQTKIVNVLLFLVTGIILVACGVLEVERGEQATTIADSIIATQIAQAPSSPPTPTVPPPVLNCPEPTTDTLLLTDEDGSYCFLYPQWFGVVIPYAGEVCLIQGEPPYIACNGASLILNVEGADGRTIEQVADPVAVDMNCSYERYNITIANEEAVVLTECKGQDLTRKVFIIHAERLYTLTFINLSERFYAQVITSFSFLR